MTQFPPTPEHQPTYAGDQHTEYAMPAKTSGLAIGGFVCSVIFCCPITTILGPILGLIALMSMKGRADVKGRGLAIAAIIIGVILTALWIVVGAIGIPIFKRMAETVANGPQEALRMASDGDIQGFQDQFVSPGGPPSSAAASNFIDELEARYGTFVGSALDESNPQANNTTPGQPEATLPYLLTFSNDTVVADVTINFAHPVTGKVFDMSLSEIHVVDTDLGDLIYPPRGGGNSTSAPSAPVTPDGSGAAGEGGG